MDELMRSPVFGRVMSIVQLTALILFATFGIAAVVFLVGAGTYPDRDALGSTAGTLAAGAGVFFAAWQWGQQDASQRSKFALDMAMEGVQRAHTILAESKIATRIQWINAARVLARAVQTSKNITSHDHRDAWNQFREEWLIRFFYYLRRSPEYYMGLPEPEDFDPLKLSYPDAKIKTLLKQTAIESTVDTEHSHRSGSGNSYLEPLSLKVIYAFAQYDADWQDPLDVVERFTTAERKSAGRRDMPGLHIYLDAVRRFETIGGNVKEIRRPDGTRIVSDENTSDFDFTDDD